MTSYYEIMYLYIFLQIRIIIIILLKTQGQKFLTK